MRYLTDNRITYNANICQVTKRILYVATALTCTCKVKLLWRLNSKQVLDGLNSFKGKMVNIVRILNFYFLLNLSKMLYVYHISIICRIKMLKLPGKIIKLLHTQKLFYSFIAWIFVSKFDLVFNIEVTVLITWNIENQLRVKVVVMYVHEGSTSPPPPLSSAVLCSNVWWRHLRSAPCPIFPSWQERPLKCVARKIGYVASPPSMLRLKAPGRRPYFGPFR